MPCMAGQSWYSPVCATCGVTYWVWSRLFVNMNTATCMAICTPTSWSDTIQAFRPQSTLMFMIGRCLEDGNRTTSMKQEMLDTQLRLTWRTQEVSSLRRGERKVSWVTHCFYLLPRHNATLKHVGPLGTFARFWKFAALSSKSMSSFILNI